MTNETDGTGETLPTHPHTPHTPQNEKEAARRKELALVQAWERGRLRYKLDSNQRKVDDAIEKCTGGSFYFDKPRRIGGSYLLCVRATERSLRKPHAQVKYAAPTAKAVRKIIGPNLRKILEDCPVNMRPKFNALDGEFRFPHNGAVLTIAGCDNQQYENLRGTEADEVEVDEAGFIDDLPYILSDVFAPQTQDTEGKVVISSTPARSPMHESVKIALEHKALGNYYHCTVYDNPRLSPERREKFLRKLAGMMPMEEYLQTVTFRREYMAEHIVDQDYAVIPEWNAEREKNIVVALERPPYFDAYTSLDVGWRDGMAVLFGYWDFKRAALVIEDEWLRFKTTIGKTAEAIIQAEKSLWPDKVPYLRISDNDLLTIAELNASGLSFIPTQKDDKELQVNNLREWVRNGKLYIHPRCKRLLAQMAGTIWNKNRTSYERTSEGHGDLLDALVYMVRNVRRNRDPFPETVNMNNDNWVNFNVPKQSRLQEAFDELYTLPIGEA
jgi:hypothetical protein